MFIFHQTFKPHQKILNSSDPPNLCTWQCAALWNTTSQGIGFTMLGASAVSQSDRRPTFFSTPKKQPAFSKCNTKPGRSFFMSALLLNAPFPTLRRKGNVKYLESRTRSKTEHRIYRDGFANNFASTCFIWQAWLGCHQESCPNETRHHSSFVHENSVAVSVNHSENLDLRSCGFGNPQELWQKVLTLPAVLRGFDPPNSPARIAPKHQQSGY